MNVINFSGGRTSAYMTKKLIDDGIDNFLVMFQNTGKEHPGTLDFINECDKRWNLNVIWIEYRFGNKFEIVNYETASRDGKPFNELIQYKNGFLPNVVTRYCTDQLKIQTQKRYLKSIGVKNWIIYNGIRYDEPHRWSKMKNLPSFYDIELPLVKNKTTKNDVLNFWKNQNFDLQIDDYLGNCDLCFLKGTNKLQYIANKYPNLFDWWIQHEKTSTFKKNISYQKIKENSQKQISLFDDDDFPCFCNID